MFCPNCGQQIPEGSIFCPACGANLQYQSPEAPPVNLEEQNTPGFASILRQALASSKFLAMCIIVTIAALLACAPVTTTDLTTGAVSSSSNFDLFGILSTIAMWITYAKAKSSDTIMSVGGLKFSSGIAKATWIVNWIVIVVFFVCGVIFIAAGPMIGSFLEDPSFIEEFNVQFQAQIGSIGAEDLTEMLSADMVGIFVTVFSVVFIVAAIIMLVFNILYYGKVCKFARNLHVSYITNKVTDLRFSTISKWFMVLGILDIICSVSSLFVSPAAGASAILSGVSLILASTWVKALGEAAAMIPQPIEENPYNVL